MPEPHCSTCFGSNLHRIRLEKDWTLPDFAAAMSVRLHEPYESVLLRVTKAEQQRYLPHQFDLPPHSGPINSGNASVGLRDRKQEAK